MEGKRFLLNYIERLETKLEVLEARVSELEIGYTGLSHWSLKKLGFHGRNSYTIWQNMLEELDKNLFN